jgi:hypothetical protein
LASSGVTHRVTFCGGIFTGMPGMSICVVISQRPGLIWLCDSSGTATTAQNANVIIRRDLIDALLETRCNADGF